MGRVCMGRVCYGPSLSWAEFVMGRVVQLPSHPAVTSSSSSDAFTTCQPCVILFYSIGNSFARTEPSRSATERSGVRFRN